VKTIDLLFEETGLSVDEIASRAKLPPERVEAIAVGRWTPSPDERQRLAQAFGVSIDDVSWGHTMAPRVVRYHRFGLREGF
jgi:transcriptional regulator with XRE-family HTH domain